MLLFNLIYSIACRFMVVHSGEFCNRLFVIQKRAIRIICKVNNREHTENLFKMMNILPLNKLIIYRTILYYNKNPTFVQLSTGRSVRQSNYIQFLCKTTRGQHQLKYRLVKILNLFTSLQNLTREKGIREFLHSVSTDEIVSVM